MSATGPLCEPVPLPLEDIQALDAMRREGKFPISSDEQYRLSVLHAYNLLDTGREQGFDRLTKLGQRIFDVPIILVSLVDTKRQWFKSRVGLAAMETDREHAFCNYVVTKDAPDVFIVLDTHLDDRFKNNVLVTGAPFIRFYAGAAVKVEGGVKLGTFCIIDTKPHPEFGLKEQRNLMDLAGLVSDELELRMRSAAQLTLHKQRYISCAAHDLQTPVTSFQLAMDMLADTKLGDEQLELVEHARTTVDLMRSTLNKAVAMGNAAPGSKAGELKWKRIVVATLVERVKRVMSLLPKQVPLTYELASDVPRQVWTDETLACQCALNFLTNAADATSEGKIVCRFAKPESAACHGGLRVEVEDTGRGVDESSVALFQAFPQRDAEDAAAKKSGLGLGLFSVLTNVRMLGGSCGGGNRTDGVTGCLFWFEVPSQTPDRAGPSMADQLSERMRADMSVVRSRPESKRSMRRRMLEEARAQADEIARVFVSEPTPATSQPFRVNTDHLESSSMSTDVPDAENKSQRSTRHSVSASAELAPLPDPSMESEDDDDDAADDDGDSTGAAAASAASMAKPRSIGPVNVGGRAVGSGPLVMPPRAGGSVGGQSEDPAGTHASLGAPLPADGPRHASGPQGQSAVFESCALSSIAEPSDGALAIVVDDSAVVRKMVARALRASGFRVDLAANGREAADMMCSGTHYALALVDFLMPVCDGVECVAEYREWEAGEVGEAVRGDKGPLKIIGMSANAGENDVKAGREAGMNDFLRKPMSLVKLRRELEALKDAYGMRDAAEDDGTMFSGADVPSAAQGPLNEERAKAVLTQERLPRMPNLTTPEPGAHSSSQSLASQEDIADMGAEAAEALARRDRAKGEAGGSGIRPGSSGATRGRGKAE